MKVIEKEIKEGFINLFRERKKKRMLQYKFKDEFLDSLQSCFNDDTKPCSNVDSSEVGDIYNILENALITKEVDSNE